MTDSSCRECAGLYRVIRSEVRKNENRRDNGRPVDLNVITRAKADLAECERLGHRGPAWQRTPA